MKLTNLQINDRAKIIKIDANKALKKRFNSFGIVKGEELSVKAYSLGKQTIEIEIGSTLVAMRDDEADKIKVEKLV